MKILNFKLKIGIVLLPLILLTLYFLPKTADASLLSRAPNNLGLVGYSAMNEGSGTQVGLPAMPARQAVDVSGSENSGRLK